MSISIKSNTLLSHLKSLVSLQKLNLSLDKFGHQAQFYADVCTDSALNSVRHGETPLNSKWKKLDSRTLGLTRSMISEPSWIVLKILQNGGYESYLVGGCVRDLVLNKIPKDFDVITTATLKKIRGLFRNSTIIGRRFPICMVRLKGAVIEVSSFETVAKNSEGKEKYLVSKTPKNSNKLDVLRWRNSMHRDFTINSLFYNPFANTIYDYADGMTDLRSLNLRTLVPAQVSFKEDCARILRGLRLAARLGLNFSKETETAIRKLSSSIRNLPKDRIIMELNYMFSYGAAGPSLCLLQKFNLLHVLLPFHADYLTQQARKSSESSVMLTKLFVHMDQLIACDRPSNSILWVGLLAFHLALVKNPQSPLVVLAFASVIYHRNWQKALIFTRENAKVPVKFTPEILENYDLIPDDELAERITQFASLVKESIDVFTESPASEFSGLVSISRKLKGEVVNLFDLPTDNVESHNKKISSLKIDYKLLTKGDVRETRFVLAKIILDTIVNDDVIIKVDKKRIVDYELKQKSVKKQKPVSLDQDFVEKKDNEVVNNEVEQLLQNYPGKKVNGKIIENEKNDMPNLRTSKREKTKVTDSLSPNLRTSKRKKT